MEPSLPSIQALVDESKREMFSSLSSNLYSSSFVYPSAYETAWLAMIPADPQAGKLPMFKVCLHWVLHNQKDGGFWGGESGDGFPTIDALPATLACIVALKMWGIGDANIKKGLEFVCANAEIILKGKSRRRLPRWFVLVFPSMVELAQTKGLNIAFPSKLTEELSCIFFERQRILESEELDDENNYPPLLSYLDAMPPTYEIDQEVIKKHIGSDGSLFQSPSATAQAFMATGDQRCLSYLRSLVRTCPNGVPPMYPIDEDLVKLCIVDKIQRLGLAEHFGEEIEEILSTAHRNYEGHVSHDAEREREARSLPLRLFKDSLAFRLLRLHGYDVTPWNYFCWFVHDEDAVSHIENESGYFASAMFNVYRATDLMFSGEYEMMEARSFSRKILEKSVMLENSEDIVVTFPNFRRMVEHELNLPWIARLDHLDHRFCIEQSKAHPLWVGKSSFYRLPCLHSDKLMKLAVEYYKFRQAIYQNELEQVRRWCKKWGLSDMGFGREKTTYCYFAVACSTSLPHDSIVRTIVAKTASLTTFADDFFDMKGSLHELQRLTEAVHRWDGEGLDEHGMIIFNALDDLVNDIATEYLHRHGSDIIEKLRNMWRETFASWMMEASWSKNGHIPSIDEYLKTGMTSIAAHTIVLSGSCFVNPELPDHKFKPPQYETITKLLMVTTRMLNDTQSYQKEQVDGKKNLVLLHLKENPEADIEGTVAYIQEMVEEKKKQLLEHALIDGLNDLPKSCNHLHLQSLKVFQMFFSAANNRFDSETELINDIKKAIFVPPEHHISKPMKQISIPVVVGPSRLKKENLTISDRSFDPKIKHGVPRMPTREGFPKAIAKVAFQKVVIPPKLSICFI